MKVQERILHPYGIEDVNKSVKKSQISIMLLFIPLLVICFSSASFASPLVTGVSQQSNVLTVTGSSFSTKATPVPVYWDDFESYSLNVAPTAGGWIVDAGTPTVSSERSYSGGKAVRFSTTVFDAFQHMRKDMGTTFPNTIYYRGKNYLDDTGNSCTTYQWKGIFFGSSPGVYDPFENSTAPNKTAELYMNTFMDVPNNRWHGSDDPAVRYNGGDNGIPVGAPLYGEISVPSDIFPLRQWFDYEFIFTQSSAAGVADGSVILNVNGINKIHASGLTTYGPNDAIHRYMRMAGDIISCRIDPGYVQTNPNYKVYYDDIYVDTTQSRVEICDTPTWSARTHCEIQPPTTWIDGRITSNINPGSFTVGQNVYAYVVDSTGAANSNGTMFTLGASSASTMPAPLNLTATNY